MITQVWRAIGIAFALGLLVVVALRAGSDPLVWQHGEFFVDSDVVTLALRVDDLSLVMLAIVGVVGACVHVYSIGYLHGEPRTASYHAIVTLFTAAMATVVVADDLFVLLIGWEVMGACSYLLIGHYWERRDARSGAVKAFLMTRLGDVGFLFGIFVVGLSSGSFRISGLETSDVPTIGAILLLCGVVGKSAQIPLLTWLPDAMPGPSPVSALIHAATMVAAGVFLVARTYDVFLAAPGALGVLAVIASLTMLVAALCATAATEVKRVLAWSTVSQLAIMLGGLAVGTHDGREAGLFHLVTHAGFKALLFLGAGVLLHQVGSAAFAVLRRSARGGELRRAMPVTFVTMTVGLAALAGVPGLSGFFSKDAVIEAAWHVARDGSWQGWTVLVAVLLTAVLTAFYATRLWLWVFFGTPAVGVLDEELPGYDDEPGEITEGSRWMLGPMVLLALASLALGYLRLDTFSVPVAAISLLALVLGVVAAYSLWRRGADPRPAVFEREFGIDRVYDVGIVRPVRLLARAVMINDNDVVDGYVRGAGRTGMLLSAGFRRLQSGNVQSYLTAAAIGVVALAVLAGVIGS